MKIRILMLVGIFAVTLMSQPASAQQEACPALVSQALAAVENACGGVGRNQACYGNFSLSATPRDATVPLNFNTAGDVVGVEQIAALQLAAMTEAASEWGVAVMALQANLPDNLPGQNATIILFGDVTIENRGDVVRPLPDVFVHMEGADHQVANVRQAPDRESARLDMILNTTAPQRAVGRVLAPGEFEDEWWLRVVLDNGTDGWVLRSNANLVVTGDMFALPLSSPSDPAPQALDSYRSMQAFSLRTGIGAPSCSEAPADGIIIQTPDGAGDVALEINQVTLTLGSPNSMHGSTAVMRTTDSTLRIALVEGYAGIEASAGRSAVIQAGHVGVFQLDANGDATGEYTVENYSDTDVASLPIALLPRQIEVRSAGEIAALRAAPVRDGRWAVLHPTLSWTGTDLEFCERLANDSMIGWDEAIGSELYATTTNADDTLTVRYLLAVGEDLIYTRDDDGIWRVVFPEEYGFTAILEYVFEGDTGIHTMVYIFSDGPLTCTTTTHVRLAFVGD